MKKLSFILLLIFVTQSNAVNVGATKTSKMGISIAGVGNDTADLRQLCQTIKDDLDFTQQFAPNVIVSPKINSKQDILNLKSKGGLLLIIKDVPQQNITEWRLFNTGTAKQLVGKKMVKRGKEVRWWGHALAGRVLDALTGKEEYFSSKIVYCKESPNKKKTQICTSDFNGKYEKILVDSNSLAIAPRWNGNAIKPIVLYSEYTASNLRLMAVNLEDKKKRVATSFDGLNMLPAFSKDGKEVIVCLSVEGSSQLYRYAYSKRKKMPEYVRLTHNDGNNISPTVLNDGSIVFCSDFETKRPHIYKMDKKGENIKRISETGSCSSPTYCPVKNRIAYSRLISGVSQIMVYDLDTEHTKQLTSDLAHKEEASWSPCGNYLVFSVSDKTTKRLAIENLLTKKRIFITGSNYRYSYPSWSPRYPLFPVGA